MIKSSQLTGKVLKIESLRDSLVFFTYDWTFCAGGAFINNNYALSLAHLLHEVIQNKENLIHLRSGIGQHRFVTTSKTGQKQVKDVVEDTSFSGDENQRLAIIIVSSCTRSVRKVSVLPSYLRAIVFERPLRGTNVNSKASRTYRLPADICRTYSSCAVCLCLQSYF